MMIEVITGLMTSIRDMEAYMAFGDALEKCFADRCALPGSMTYCINKERSSCVLFDKNGRDLGFCKNNSIDCIITDHPWLDVKSNVGGNRNFTPYDCFQYTIEDFKEKARVLKSGAFLIEFLPEENASNYEYLFNLKKMALRAGFEYYAKVPWVKAGFVANTGRKSKNSEDIMFFTKGRVRCLRDNKKTGKKMSGAAAMLPASFIIAPGRKVHPSEKPVELIMQILDFVTLEYEVVLDQFAGSGVTGKACLSKNRNCLLIENCDKYVQNVKICLGLKESHNYT